MRTRAQLAQRCIASREVRKAPRGARARRKSPKTKGESSLTLLLLLSSPGERMALITQVKPQSKFELRRTARTARAGGGGKWDHLQ